MPPFTLLSDPDKKVMEKYGAYGEKMMYGKKTQGVIRSTVWIGPDGKVVKHWARVAKAADHPDKVLEALDAIPAPDDADVHVLLRIPLGAAVYGLGLVATGAARVRGGVRLDV